MALTKQDLVNNIFAVSGEDAALSGQHFDTTGGFFLGPAAVGKSLDPAKLTKDISVKLDPLKSKFGALEADTDDDDTPTDALAQLQQSIQNIGGIAPAPSSLQPTTYVPDRAYTAGTDKWTSSVGVPTTGGVIDDISMLGEYETFAQPKTDWTATISQSLQDPNTAKLLGKGSEYFKEPPPTKSVTALPGGHPEYQQQTYGMPVTTYTSSAAIPAGHPSGGGITEKGFGQTVGAGAGGAQMTPWQSASTTSQIMTVGSTIGSLYSIYQNLKGGVQGPQQALGLASGFVGLAGGLGGMGLLGSSSAAWAGLAAGPVGIGLMAASMLAGSGVLGGRGKSKPPMGGVEIRLADENGVVEQYNRNRLIKGHKEYNPEGIKLVAGSASSYNGFDAGAVATHLEDKIDYLYAFADKFNLKVDAAEWYKAAYGIKDNVNTAGIAKYKPRGAHGGRSPLEKIDSAGDGAASPDEWLRHIMEYQSADGSRILSGQTRLKQAAFQRRVDAFNKEYWAA